MREPSLPGTADSGAELRALFAHLPEGALMLARDGTVLSANRAAERIFLFPANGLQGRAAPDLLADDGPMLPGLLRKRTAGQLHATGKRADGTLFAVEFSFSRLRLDGRRHYAVIVRDVSSRRETERRTRTNDERRRKYFTTATHELRTPMASVLGFSELLLKRDFTQDGAREIIGIIHTQAKRLVDLINEMLDLARIETGGKDALNIQPREAGPLLAQTLVALDGIGEHHDIRLDTAPDLPPVLADAAKMQQVLLNVISNAIKYSPAGSVIEIGASAAQLGGAPAVAFRVKDHGVGITPEQQTRVFDAFYRSGGNTGVIGSGLGLTIVKELIGLHNGSVQLESALGAGTQITLLVPAA